MIKLGTSGFSFPDWKGTVYPQKLKQADMLEYYEQELGFEACELNFTYYRLPDPYTMEKMGKKVGRDFEFTIKASKEMTHEFFDKGIKEIRPIFKAFHQGIEPLAAAGKLGAILLQFPTFFKHTEENLEYLEQAKDWLKPYPLVIEFRNRDWLGETTYKLLKKDKLGICVVDEPALPRLLPYEPMATSSIGYFRFHGRNKQWFQADAHQRYNYLYSPAELKGFLPGIKQVAQQTTKTFAFFNNCFMGQSAQNAAQIREMLGIKFQKRSPRLF
jgi:uncharacterized protein YecE (DUF72 family)